MVEPLALSGNLARPFFGITVTIVDHSWYSVMADHIVLRIRSVSICMINFN